MRSQSLSNVDFFKKKKSLKGRMKIWGSEQQQNGTFTHVGGERRAGFNSRSRKSVRGERGAKREREKEDKNNRHTDFSQSLTRRGKEGAKEESKKKNREERTPGQKQLANLTGTSKLKGRVSVDEKKGRSAAWESRANPFLPFLPGKVPSSL